MEVKHLQWQKSMIYIKSVVLCFPLLRQGISSNRREPSRDSEVKHLQWPGRFLSTILAGSALGNGCCFLCPKRKGESSHIGMKGRCTKDRVYCDFLLAAFKFWLISLLKAGQEILEYECDIRTVKAE